MDIDKIEVKNAIGEIKDFKNHSCCDMEFEFGIYTCCQNPDYQGHKENCNRVTAINIIEELAGAYLSSELVESMDIFGIKDILNSTCQECEHSGPECHFTCSILASKLVGKVGKEVSSNGK